MKLTKRQLNKIITESLGIQINELKSPRQIAQEFKDKKLTKKIGKNLDAWNIENRDNPTGPEKERLEKLLTDQKNELRTAYDAAAFDDMDLKEKAAAKKLLDTLESVLENPKSPKSDSKEDEQGISDRKPEPTPEPTEPEPTPWNPDPDPKVGWEYQVRKCIWYTRKKETTKEYKLGHASGKPLEKGGKFFNSIVELNNAYPDLVKDCNPVKKKKKPTPKPADKGSAIEVKYVKPSGGESGLKALVMTELVTAFRDFKGDSNFEKLVNQNGKAYNAARPDLFGIKGIDYETRARFISNSKQEKSRELKDVRVVKQFIKGIAGNETAKSGKIVDVLPKVIYYAQPEAGQGDGHIFLFAVTAEDTVDKDEKIILYKFHVGAQGNVVGGLVSESLSRGALYRRRYYGRY